MNILAQATLRCYDIVDCVVMIDLSRPPSVAVKLIANLSPEERSAWECLVMERSQGGLASICHFLSPDGPTLIRGDEHRLAMFDSWEQAQTKYNNGDFANEYHCDESTRVMRELFFDDLSLIT